MPFEHPSSHLHCTSHTMCCHPHQQTFDFCSLSSLPSALCFLSAALCPLPFALCPLYSLPCLVPSALLSTLCPFYSASVLCSLPFVLSTLCPLYSLSSLLCPLSSALCPLLFALCPLYSLSSLLCPLSSRFCPPKDSKLYELLRLASSSDYLDPEQFLTLVYRREGIVNLEYIQLMASSADVADRWRKAVNGILFNMLRFNASTLTFFKRK